MDSSKPSDTVSLSEPQNSDVSLEKALLTRRSIRNFKGEPPTKVQVSQLLWAAQGVTHPKGFRAAPSAGALYPLEIFLVAGTVRELEAAVFKYDPVNHEMTKTRNGDARAGLCRSAYGQRSVLYAPLSLAVCAVYGRVTKKYGKRGIRYVHMEAGHAAQNICLQAAALGLGTVVIGSFNDDGVKAILNAGSEEEPLYVIPTGYLP